MTFPQVRASPGRGGYRSWSTPGARC